jgi:hypothetical protein
VIVRIVRTSHEPGGNVVSDEIRDLQETEDAEAQDEVESHIRLDANIEPDDEVEAHIRLD